MLLARRRGGAGRSNTLSFKERDGVRMGSKGDSNTGGFETRPYAIILMQP
jgi:hypothetical protein